MKTDRFFADPLLAPPDLDLVVKLLSSSIVALPTETVYGLAADVFREDAVKQIFAAKKRPADNPLIVHISDLVQTERLAKDIPPYFYRLAERFWPGPLTIVLQGQGSISPIVTGGLSTVALRMPSHPVMLQILKALGSPLAAPSANVSGRPSATSAEDVLEDFTGIIPAVVDGGVCRFGIESTVVSLLGSVPVLLRPGALPREKIEEALSLRLQGPPEQGPVLSPGMKYRHYAPKAAVLLIEKGEEVQGYVPKNLCASNLFYHLRQADRLGFSHVTVVVDEKVRSDEALMDRLLRAAK